MTDPEKPMTRDQFNKKLQELVSLAYEEQMSMMAVWGTLSEQLKIVEMMMEAEFVAHYRKTGDDETGDDETGEPA